MAKARAAHEHYPTPPEEREKRRVGCGIECLVGSVRNGGNIMRDNTFTKKKEPESELERERGFLSSQQTPPLGHYRLFVPMLVVGILQFVVFQKLVRENTVRPEKLLVDLKGFQKKKNEEGPTRPIW
jgi:hypothetical protein